MRGRLTMCGWLMMRGWLTMCVAAALGAVLMSGARAEGPGQLGWLAGNWIARTAGGEVRENWLGPSGGMLVATNLTTNGTRVTFEFLRIAERDGRLVYFASPGGRPPVEFPARETGAASVVFENAAHGYPARIIYRRDGEALIARVEGTRGGKETAEEWRFVRAP